MFVRPELLVVVVVVEVEVLPGAVDVLPGTVDALAGVVDVLPGTEEAEPLEDGVVVFVVVVVPLVPGFRFVVLAGAVGPLFDEVLLLPEEVFLVVPLDFFVVVFTGILARSPKVRNFSFTYALRPLASIS